MGPCWSLHVPQSPSCCLLLQSRPRAFLGKTLQCVCGGGGRDPTLLLVRGQRRSSQKRGVTGPRAGADLGQWEEISNYKDKETRAVRTSEKHERLKVNLECPCKPLRPEGSGVKPKRPKVMLAGHTGNCPSEG